MVGSLLTKVQIGDPITIDFQASADFANGMLVWHHVAQHGPGVSDQSIRPARNDTRTNDANRRINPSPVQCPCRKKAADCQDRRSCFGEDVKVGRTEVIVRIVVMMVAMRVIVVMALLTFTKQPRAREICDQSKGRDAKGFAIGDWAQPQGGRRHPLRRAVLRSVRR